MKRLLPGSVALLLLSCGDVPSIEIGGSGARLLNGQARDTFDAYVMAYSNLSPQHLRVRQCLEARMRHLVGAASAVERIVYYLETMQSLVTPDGRAQFDPYLAKYREWHRDIQADRWGGSFLNEFDRTEREVKARFHPQTAEVMERVEPAAEAKESPPPPKPADPVRPAPGAEVSRAVPADKAEVPAATDKPPAEPEPKREKPTPLADPSALYYKAWDVAHDDLLAAFKAKKDCAAAYRDLTGALRLLKARMAGPRADTLQIYIDYYAGIREKTRDFAALPEKTTEQDILDELNVAARVLRKEFNPGR